MAEYRKGYRSKVLSSLAKVFSDEEPVFLPECTKLTGLWGETVSFQVAYIGEGPRRELLDIRVNSDIASHVRVRTVEQVPVGRATNGIVDDNYLRTASGMYPDLLRDIPDGRMVCCSTQWRSIWVDVELEPDVPAGMHQVEIAFRKEGRGVMSECVSLQVYGAVLDEQRIMHTEWIHPDCLADYYRVEVFSEEHWRLLGNCFREMVDRGCNMMLCPLFTPPLDTGVGLERTTVQLVDVELSEEGYVFGFDNLKRWIDLCSECGVRYFEMSHLFSQWGAKHPPKVMANKDGELVKIFGWHTPAVGEYTGFLESFLPQLIAKLREWGIAERVFFHISDEPLGDLDGYNAAKSSLGNLLDGFRSMDAVSCYEIYERGIVDIPIPGNNELDDFIANEVPDQWTYYCTGQFLDVSNRFMAMPSARNRIYGVQLYKYNIVGILHWGYNFYNSQYSISRINPYAVTDAGGAFPSGDPFLVYPGSDGMPEESIRMMVHYQALTDLRALQMLERLAGRDFVMDLIEGDLGEPLTFTRYPKSDMYLISLRNRVNREIAKRAGE